MPDQILEMDPWTRHDRTLDLMEKQGGSFVQALAVAWRRADDYNAAKLMFSFGAYYMQYADDVDRAHAAGKAVPA